MTALQLNVHGRNTAEGTEVNDAEADAGRDSGGFAGRRASPGLRLLSLPYHAEILLAANGSRP